VAVSRFARVWYRSGGYRSSDAIAVTVFDCETGKRIARLPCGEGWTARPIAFSSDGNLLVTVHDVLRPSVRLWRLSPPSQAYND
jgi:hypothetical protein